MNLEDISLDRVLGRVKQCGECLEWDGYAAEGKFPQIRINGVCGPVRRVVWTLARGELKAGIQVGVKCKNPLCVNPDHLVARTRSKIQTGAKRTVAHVQKIAARKRAASKLSMEMVREIRASEEPNAVLAERYGITAGYVSHLRRGDRLWKEYTANPFYGLGARK